MSQPQIILPDHSSDAAVGPAEGAFTKPLQQRIALYGISIGTSLFLVGAILINAGGAIEPWGAAVAYIGMMTH